jgi:hypothetical protein
MGASIALAIARIAVGLLTPLAGLAEASVMTVATMTRAHAGFWSRRGGYDYPALLAILNVAFIWSGAGRYSVDTVIGWPAPDWDLALDRPGSPSSPPHWRSRSSVAAPIAAGSALLETCWPG